MKNHFILLALSLIFSTQTAFANEPTVFEKLDTNKDNKISQEEFEELQAKRANRIFKRGDSNKDGYLSIDEWEDIKAKLEKYKQEKNK